MKMDLVIVSGFSASGKGTVLRKLLSLHPELRLIKSYTTRKRRDESDYYTFVSLPEFMRLKEEGFFLECNNYSGSWYGTPVYEVENAINQGKTAIVEVDTNGYIQILKSIQGKNYHVLSVYIVADADTIIERLLKRNTECLEKILMRLKTSLTECEHIDTYDMIVPNYSLDTSTEIIKNAIFNGKYAPSSFDAKKFLVRMKKIIWLLDS